MIIARTTQLAAGGKDVAAFAFTKHGGKVSVQQNLLKCFHIV